MVLAFYPEERGLAGLNSIGSTLPVGYCPRETLDLSSIALLPELPCLASAEAGKKEVFDLKLLVPLPSC